MQKNLKYWLALNSVPDLGPITIKKMWDHFKDIKAIWEAEEASFSRIEGLNKAALRAFLDRRGKINLERELKNVLSCGAKVFTLEDEEYPISLKNIYAPPPVLYIKGELLKSDEKALAIVGTRKASLYGREMAGKLASQLASLGITVVSGLALGIDTAAHAGALEARGRTLAVFGCGIDIIYPPGNKNLSERIKSSGALVSEFPVGTGTGKGTFPRRNRIISGLSLGTIVIEGHYDSGAMITAKYALDQGREVFAVPGNVELEQSKGPHWLIKQGAKLVESVEDILEELNIKIIKNDKLKMSNEGKDYSGLSKEEQKLISLLSFEPKHMDNILNDSDFTVSEVAGLLMILEIKKIVRKLPGQYYSLA